MTKLAEKIIDEVRKLEAEDRAEVADRIYEEFGSFDREIDVLWKEEIRKRIEDRDSGQTTSVDWEVIRLEMGLPPRQQ